MKRFTMIAAILLALSCNGYAQKSTFNKITTELQEELDKRPSADKTFSIIITMTDEYDQVLMANEIQHMKSKERRIHVVDKLKQFSKVSQSDLLQLLNEGVKSEIVKDVKSFWLFNGLSCTTTREMIETLAQRKDIAVIDLDRIVMLPDNEKATEVTEAIRDLAWHVSQVHANDVWTYNGESGYDGTGVIVAIIDTGVNYNHIDLVDHMWDGGTEYPNHGYDFQSNDNDPMDENGHGSHCAGITAGDGTSGTQTGIAPNATIMALKVFGASGGASTDDILNAMEFAVEREANIVSMSLGASGDSGHAYYRQAFVNMMNANVVAAVAAGNDGQKYGTYSLPTNIGSPGNCPSPWHNPDQTLSGGQSAVITIGASNRNDRKTTFSSFGPVTWGNVNGYSDYPYTAGSTSETGLIKPDIITPGADIVSCNYSTNNGLVSKMGTSMATPLAAGIMALMLQANPNLTPAQIDEILETTAFPVDYRTTKNNYTGAGRADALACIDAIFTQATKPTNLILEPCGGNVTLTWTASTTAPNGYCIYRDNVQVGTTSTNSYLDENVEMGKHVYYVRANDNNNHQSVRSNAMLCNIEPYASIPDNLTISWDGTNAILDWNASTTNSNNVTSTDLYFSMSTSTAFRKPDLNTTLFWGIKYEPEDLRNFIGMSIDQISIGIYSTNLTHTIRIYRGTSFGNTTGAPVYSQSFTPTCSQWGTQIVTLNTPYLIDDITEDLWITCSATLEGANTFPATVGIYTGHSSNCFYLTSGDNPNSVIWGHSPDGGDHYAACIKAHLTRTTTYTPTYNVYLDNSSEATGLTATTYTDNPTIHSGENVYHVTSRIGDNESCPSNDAKIIVIDNTQTENDNISIGNNSIYIITPTGKLTTNGSLVSTDPTRFIIEDGAQLIHNSSGVKATVKKDITAYTANDNGWYFIASPVTENTTATAANGLLTNNYDLYAFDQSQDLEWRNHEANNFPLAHKTGYLYGNSGNTTLTFAGTLAATTEPTTLAYDNNASLKGFNLIGNPYPCNTTITNDFYTTNGSTVILAQTGTVIAPCEGVFVKATGASQSVTFNKAVSAKGSVSGNCIDLVISQKQERDGGSTPLDRARVRFGEGIGMEKLSLDENHSRLTLWQGGQDYAVAYADGQNELPVNFKAAENGTYTLAFEVENLDLDYLHLIDNMTGDEVDVLAMPAYTFEAKTSDYASRFKLVFSEPTDGPSADDQPFAYYANGEIRIVADVCDASLQVVDVTGRVVASVGEHTRCVPTTGMAPGVYVLRLINGDNVRTQKIVIE